MKLNEFLNEISYYKWDFTNVSCLRLLSVAFESTLPFIKQKFDDIKVYSFVDFLQKDTSGDGSLNYDVFIESIINEIKNINISYGIFLDIINKMRENSKSNVITVGIEYPYIDRVHRDSYYSYYSEMHTQVSRYCKRLVFIDCDVDMSGEDDEYVNTENFQQIKKIFAENFIGSIVIRPLKNGMVGRTLMKPKYILSDNHGNRYYIRTCDSKISYKGVELSLMSFPYLTQDGITATCAETSIIIMMDYYSRMYQDYRFAVPSDISRIAQKEGFSRSVPSSGLNYQTISKVLCSFGFFTKCYAIDNLRPSQELKNILYYYIESGMPICINLSKQISGRVKGHAIVCIGHQKIPIDKITNNLVRIKLGDLDIYYTSTASGFDTMVAMDDCIRPYTLYQFELNNNPYSKIVKNISYETQASNPKQDSDAQLSIDCFIVPLHKRMNMDAQRAESTIQHILELKDLNPCYVSFLKGAESKWGSKKDPLIYRLFLASSRHLKEKRMSNSILGKCYKLLYDKTPLPQFVWVCEFYDSSSYSSSIPKARGEIILDATMETKESMSDGILMINYTSVGVYYAKRTDGRVFPYISDNLNDKIALLEYNEHFELEGYDGNLLAI